MTTKEELIAQFKAENPKVISILNGEKVELTPKEYEDNAIAWAEMRFEQIKAQTELNNLTVSKAALLERLGITEDEAKLLLA